MVTLNNSTNKLDTDRRFSVTYINMKYLQVKVEHYITGIEFLKQTVSTANEMMGLTLTDDERFIVVLLWRFKAQGLEK